MLQLILLVLRIWSSIVLATSDTTPTSIPFETVETTSTAPIITDGDELAQITSTAPIISDGEFDHITTTEVVSDRANGSDIDNDTGEIVTYRVDLNAPFIHELDELDDYMINITDIQFDPVCVQSNISLAFCGVIDYPIPKTLSEAPYFQDNMARTAVDTLSILTKGATTSCEEQLKRIYCQQKFPECFEYKETMNWNVNSTENCFQLIEECSDHGKELLNKIQICEKLSKGKFNADECIVPMSPSSDDLCSHSNVSAWLYHSSVEINSLLRFQFTLNENLSEDCKNNLTSFLCTTGHQCFADENVEDYLLNIKTQCEHTVSSCENEELSMAIKELFMNCQKYQ